MQKKKKNDWTGKFGGLTVGGEPNIGLIELVRFWGDKESRHFLKFGEFKHPVCGRRYFWWRKDVCSKLAVILGDPLNEIAPLNKSFERGEERSAKIFVLIKNYFFFNFFLIFLIFLIF